MVNHTRPKAIPQKGMNAEKQQTMYLVMHDYVPNEYKDILCPKFNKAVTAKTNEVKSTRSKAS